ncbi:MAG TPA: hypothetical protein VHC92_16045, partial [Rhodanobacteraceae bacterium]|nr:hypothetical protein [Rhodanobacteraceae bacterium]
RGARAAGEIQAAGADGILGRRVPEYARSDVRELLERPYRIIYVVLPDRIDVIAVMHYRLLLPSDLEHLRVGERRRDPEP